MARGTGEPSTKRAKVDEAGKEEEEDPLVRRREELVRLLGRARKGKEVNKRAKEELVTLCARLEAKNEKLLGRLLPELWQKILDEYLDQNDMVALAMTCRFFREKHKDLGWKMETKLGARRLLELRRSGKMASYSLGWFRWVCDTMEILPGYLWGEDRKKGAVYDGHMLNYAVFQGSVEILKWMEKKYKWEPEPDEWVEWYVGNEETGFWAGWSGSVKVLEYLSEMGYLFDSTAFDGADRGGCLEAVKFLRDWIQRDWIQRQRR